MVKYILFTPFAITIYLVFKYEKEIIDSKLKLDKLIYSLSLLYSILYTFAYLSKTVIYLDLMILILSGVIIATSFKITKFKHLLLFIGMISFSVASVCNIYYLI